MLGFETKTFSGEENDRPLVSELNPLIRLFLLGSRFLDSGSGALCDLDPVQCLENGTWTPKVCKIMAFMAIIMGLGLLFYILLGFR